MAALHRSKRCLTTKLETQKTSLAVVSKSSVSTKLPVVLRQPILSSQNLSHIFFLQVLQSRVEEVIKDFNREMEASEERMERIRKTVMNSAKEVIAKLEEAEARRKEELGKKMNDLIGKLSSDLEVMFYCKSLAQ